jgi:ArsR family metal-binding transcriptional regulator
MKRFFTVFLGLLFLFTVVGCTQVKTITPTTPLQKIAYIDATIQTLGQVAIDAYNAGKLTQADVRYVYEALSTAATLADNAQKAYQASNGTQVNNADLILTEAITTLQKVQVFLSSKGVKNE